LAQVLRRLENLPAVTDDRLVVGIDGADDAGVFRLTDDIALVQTVDFFTPIVDDARDWGRIAAANALSDIYAMGARPLTALQLVGWPRDRLSFDLLGDVVEGGADVLAEAGCTIVGGHSVDDPEPKYGFAVTGTVHPDRVVTNVGGRPGDRLVITKPIGTGVVTTAVKRGSAPEGSEAAAVAVMAELNRAASDAMVAVGVSAATDVTGFGLLGHLGEMLGGTVGAVIDADAVPLLPGARELAEGGVVPGGTKRNLRHVEGFTDFGDVPAWQRLLLADAQTSGGLLIAVSPERCDELLARIDGAVTIGHVTDEPGRIRTDTG
jgi:selenide,water dikinase